MMVGLTLYEVLHGTSEHWTNKENGRFSCTESVERSLDRVLDMCYTKYSQLPRVSMRVFLEKIPRAEI